MIIWRHFVIIFRKPNAFGIHKNRLAEVQVATAYVLMDN